MNHGSLFSGIGGFDLAAQWMGWQNIFHCEWNEFGQKVLKYYWPNAESFSDITKTDFTKYANKIDVLTGGFPCQPYSTAGKRLGKADDRHLWPEMLRAIREIQPTWVVGENVSGLVSWNGGMVFNEVQADMEAEGYEVIPFILPACAVNAPHRRDRIWFIAYSHRSRSEKSAVQQPDVFAESGGIREDERAFANAGLQRPPQRQQQPMAADELCEEQFAANATGIRCNGNDADRQGIQRPDETRRETWTGGNEATPTPTVMDTNCGDLEKIDQRREKALASKNNGNGFGPTIGELANRGLLPTPEANNFKNGHRSETPRIQRKMEQGWTIGLNDQATLGMLPTPWASEWKGTGPIGSKSHDRMMKKGYLCATVQSQNGQTSQLNPRFVAEMMGFPPDWLELPFLNTETNP